jgi:cation:H+ antiporter
VEDVDLLEVLGLLIVLIVSLIIVIKAADIFVDNIVKVGAALGISQLILGVTIVPLGTTLPEFGSSFLATIGGSPEMGVGIVLGSNIWNVAGILGITATITGFLKSDRKSLTRDGVVAIITTIILLTLMIVSVITKTYVISGIASISFIILYIFYFRIIIKDQKEYICKISNEDKNIANEEGINCENNESTDYNSLINETAITIKDTSIEENIAITGEYTPNTDENIAITERDIAVTEENNTSNSKEKKKLNIKNIVFAIVAIACLGITCHYLIESAEKLAIIFGIPEDIMGLFTLAIGTSIPELVVTLSSAIKGLHDISMGTIFGSITLNMLIPIGILSLFVPIQVEPISLYFDAPVMLFVVASTLIILKYNNLKLNRISGLYLIGVYIAYAGLRLFVLT